MNAISILIHARPSPPWIRVPNQRLVCRNFSRPIGMKQLTVTNGVETIVCRGYDCPDKWNRKHEGDHHRHRGTSGLHHARVRGSTSSNHLMQVQSGGRGIRTPLHRSGAGSTTRLYYTPKAIAGRRQRYFNSAVRQCATHCLFCLRAARRRRSFLRRHFHR